MNLYFLRQTLLSLSEKIPGTYLQVLLEVETKKLKNICLGAERIRQPGFENMQLRQQRIKSTASRRMGTFVGVLVCAVALLVEHEVHADDFAMQPFFNQYCVRCHGIDEQNGDVDLHEIESASTGNLKILHAAMQAVKDQRMPPEDERQPDDADRAKLISYVKTQLSAVNERPGEMRIRKLSAREYRNTLRSLFGFDLAVAVNDTQDTRAEKSLVLKLMPPDPPGASGFTNDTRGHMMTQVGLDRYVYFAEAAIEQLLKSPNRRKQLEAYTGSINEAGLTGDQSQKLIARFIVRAWRRDIPEDVLAGFLTSIEGKAGDELFAAVASEMQAILASPQFLYRGTLVEVNPGESMPADSFELAERLSYFLWADMPDEELFESARTGELSQEADFKLQVNRMLDSPKARSLTEDFAREWLKIGEIHTVSKRITSGNALQDQPYEFINYLISEDRPLMELIDSDITFINFHLRNFYVAEMLQLKEYRKPDGIERESIPLQKVRLENKPGRGGLLTMPGVLAMNRGPVVRGVWMLERIVGDHLGEPPADVEPVKVKLGDKRSFRERFAEHRSNTACAVCHNRIDPLGFALQAYDAEGAYYLAEDFATQTIRTRKKKDNLPSAEELDSAGRLPTGEQFRDFKELKGILTGSYRERIVRNIVRQMLAYALCRPLELHDQPTVDRLTKKLSSPNATWRDLIHAVAGSLPFRQTYFPPPQSGATGHVQTD